MTRYSTSLGNTFVFSSRLRSKAAIRSTCQPGVDCEVNRDVSTWSESNHRSIQSHLYSATINPPAEVHRTAGDQHCCPRMDHGTQQNAAMVATTASHSLAREAAALNQLLTQFDLGGEKALTAFCGDSGLPEHRNSLTRELCQRPFWHSSPQHQQCIQGRGKLLALWQSTLSSGTERLIGVCHSIFFLCLKSRIRDGRRGPLGRRCFDIAVYLALSSSHFVISTISFFWASMIFWAMSRAWALSPCFSSTSDMLIAPM